MEQTPKLPNANDFILSYEDLKMATTQKLDQQKLLSSSPVPSPATNHNGATSEYRNGYAWLPIFALLFLTINGTTAIARAIAKNNPWMVVFIVSTYANMLLLFGCVRLFEKVPDDSKWRPHLRVAVWWLTTTLTVMFCYKVALEMPMVLKVVVWVMGGSMIAIGFYVLCVCRQERCDSQLMKGGAKQTEDEQV